MLTVGKIGGSDADGRTAGYYTASVASGRDDYYTGKGEAPGEWFGEGAARLGLEGQIDAEEFRRVVMEGVDPRSKEVLREPVGDKPVRGLDMTFSAPKSVSLLFHLGGRDISGAVRQAHDESVEAALGYMERDACVVPGCAWTASPARTCCARSPPSASARLTPPWRPGWHGT